MKKPFFLLSFLSVVLFACNSADSTKTKASEKDTTSAISHGKNTSSNTVTATVSTSGPVADAATILARQQVPVICYHQIRDWKPTDSKVARDYIIPPAVFQAQIKMLADSGYHTN